MVDRLTPQALLDLYHTLPDESRMEFLRLLGTCSTAKVPVLICKELPPEEQDRYARFIHEAFWRTLFPLLVREAVRRAKASPGITDADLETHCNQVLDEYGRQQHRLTEAKFKQQRDRKSDQENVRRNVEICALRQQDKRKWSLQKLARKYDVSVRAISKILKGEGEWRRQLANLEPTSSSTAKQEPTSRSN
jgi:hypothetical protein